jgi:putative transposase
VRKIYQNEDIDPNRPTVAEVVSVVLTELVGEVQEGLLALAVGAGLQVLTALMEEDVTARCGVEGRHDATRTAPGHGHGAGSVSSGVGYRWCGRGCAPLMAQASCRCRPMSCLGRVP